MHAWIGNTVTYIVSEYR